MARLVALLPKEMAAKEAAALNGPIEASREITPFNLAQVLLEAGCWRMICDLSLLLLPRV